MKSFIARWLPILGLVALPAFASVEVSFPNDYRYSDAGPRIDRPQMFRELAAHMQKLGAEYLPPRQDLRIEVLDLDMAGDTQFTRNGHEVRVLRGKSDFPRMTLRYSVLADGRVVSSGTETITNSDYLWFPERYRKDEYLYHEKVLIESWFHDKFAK